MVEEKKVTVEINIEGLGTVKVEGDEKNIMTVIGNVISELKKLNTQTGQFMGNTKSVMKYRTVTEGVMDLANNGFLDEPKGLGEIMKELQRKGYPFSVTTVAPVLLNLLRAEAIGRKGDRGSYLYYRLQKAETIRH